MSENNSLILAEAEEQGRKDRQLFLFCGDDLPKVDRSKPRFNYTGERLFEYRRDVYDAVVKALATPGVSIRSICTGCHVTDDTTRAVAAREKIPIAEQKKELANLLYFGARIGFERAVELLPTEKDAKNAAIASGIMSQRAMELSGEASARVEIIHKVDVSAKIDSAFEKIMWTFENMKRAQVVEMENLPEGEATDEVKRLEAALP